MPTFAERQAYCADFFADGMAIMARKGPDYSPVVLTMMDVFYAAAEDGTTPEQVLWSYARKQMSAVRTWLRTGALTGESIRERLLDIANYMALIDFVTYYRQEYLDVLEVYNNDPDHDVDPDARAAMRAWLAGQLR